MIYDHEAERELVGGAIGFPWAVADVLGDVVTEEFYDPALRAAWTAIVVLHERGEKPSHSAVEAVCRTRDPGFNVDALDAAVNFAIGRPTLEQAHRVAEAAALRRLQALCQDVSNAVADRHASFRIAGRVQMALDNLHTSRGLGAESMFDKADRQVEKPVPWVIPGMLRERWRAILVGRESQGKGVFLKQVAALASQGIHPLKFHPIEPIRALVVELENDELDDATIRMLGQAEMVAGDRADRSRCQHAFGNLDIRNRADAYRIEEECRRHRPDLLCIGPLYQATTRRGNDDYEQTAEGVQSVLDDLRKRFNLAILMEHHAPAGTARREMRPFGGMRWFAWPEIGLGMVPEKDDVRLTRWRGDRFTADWPQRLRYGSVYPWEGVWEKDGGALASKLDEEPFADEAPL